MRRLRILLATLALLPSTSHALLTIGSCTFTNNDILFGNYSPLQPNDIKTPTQFTLACGLVALLQNVEVTFSAGQSNNMTARRMVSGSHTLAYNLFKDAAYTQILGDGSNNTTTLSASILLGLGNQYNWTVYAKLPAGQAIPAGTYSDTLVVTVIIN